MAIRCPNLSDAETRREFDKITERLGGNKNVAYYLWDKHPTPEAVHRFIDAFQELRDAVGSHSRTERPDTSKPPETGASESAAPESVKLAQALAERLKAGKPITSKILQELAGHIYGGKLAEGTFDRKDMYDALETGVNMVVMDNVKYHLGIYDDWRPTVANLEKLLASLPTQTVRSEEQISFQQFSTPPHYAMAVAYAARIRDGDVLLEPSAGTGSIVAAATHPGIKVIANELSPRRAELLRELVGKDGKVFTENAEQIANILPDKGVKPTVVVMNPPFSQTAGRMGDKRDIMVGAKHIEQGLQLLEPGGRLVAIVGRGMTMGAPSYRDWWAKIGKDYSVRANIGVEGDVYKKYGTTFGTRLLVIDKTPSLTAGNPVLADVKTVEELMRVLEPIRDARLKEHPAEQPRPQPSSEAVAQFGEAKPGAVVSEPARPSALGSGGGGGGGVGRPGAVSGGGPSGPNAGVAPGNRNEVPVQQPERPAETGAGAKPAAKPGELGQPEAGGKASAPGDLQPTSGVVPSAPKIAVESIKRNAPPGSQGGAEISDTLYEQYEPQRVKVPGAAKHPGPLVESAAMSTVLPPVPTYKPSVPKAVIDKGLLSLPQLESVIYSGQAHEQMLPAAEGDTPKRKGFFIGDGTGVGKGREIAGIILDNWQQGRTKALWVSEKKKLMNDAKRDWKGLGQDDRHIFDFGKVKVGEGVKADKGIGFITYDTLKGGMSDQDVIARGGMVRGQRVKMLDGREGAIRSKPDKNNNYPVTLDDGSVVTATGASLTPVGEQKTVKSRLDQIVDWVGKDFDGVIAFDEAHNMGNAGGQIGARGEKEAAAKALAGIELQSRLPNARVVYVSATGATEVSNLSYADRLGLWGRGTPFASRNNFVAEVEGGGIAAMELIARDMKQLGNYIARNLSYDGVEYDRLEHKLDAGQREIYDELAEAWQVVLRNINAALEATGGAGNARAKSAAMSAFWGGHQRFFNQIITSLQMPTVIKAVERDLAEGRQAVLQLTNTNEAAQERAAAKAESAEELEDLDITPRDQIIQLVEHSFPTQQYEEYLEPGSDKPKFRPVFDSEGRPVQNKQALAMKEALIDRLASIRVPQGPLDMVLDHFGHENVAEITGRKRRFIMKADEKTGQRKRMEESRPSSANQAETDVFQAGKKKVLVFSEAGGTGASYHADNAAASKGARRAHYLVQAGWRADKAVQGFGRTHRTNQASAPIFHLVHTDLDGQKRFISSIARRLGQLGALTKGQRQAGDQGIFSQRDNLESKEARAALQQFFEHLNRGALENIHIDDFEEQTGLALRIKGPDGEILGMRKDLPDITKFLNRLLSMKYEMQNQVFGEFSRLLDGVIERNTQAGTLDVGLETIKADRITKESEQPVHTHKETGATTDYVRFRIENRFKPTEFDTVKTNRARPLLYWVKSPKGKVYGISQAPSLTVASTGEIKDQYRLTSPVTSSHLIEQRNVEERGTKWSKIKESEARELWQEEIDNAPEFIGHDMHLITGAILPIWDRLKGNARVVRLQTSGSESERFLGRVVPESHIQEVLRALGAEARMRAISPAKVLEHVLQDGGRVELANGWSFKRSLVAGEQRIELKGPRSFSEGVQVKQDGVFTERIGYETRYFVPTDPIKGAAVIEKLVEHRPVTGMTGGSGEPQSLGAAAVNPGTSAIGRQNAMLRFLGKGQPMDRALRIPFYFAGGIDPKGNWKPGLYLHDKAARVIVHARFSPTGRFSFLNPFFETVRNGLIDRYGLRDMPEYVERERGRSLDERAVLMQANEILKPMMSSDIGLAEAKVLHSMITEGDIGGRDMDNLAEPIRAAIDQWGQEAVSLGLISAESFERNRGSYLHRVYRKYEGDQNGLVRFVNNLMGARRKKLVGHQFKGRGMFEDMPLKRLMRDVPGFHAGARGVPEIGEKWRRLDDIPDQGQLGLDLTQPPPRPVRVVWWPADEPIPDKYSAFKDQGLWEVRYKKGGELTLWRDYTKAERVKMGEIMDARYQFAKTAMLMARDLANGHFYKDISENEDWASNMRPEGRVATAEEWNRTGAEIPGRYRAKRFDWVQVPETKIPSSNTKRWGALAGMYVREEIWRDLNEIDLMSKPHFWRTMLTQWKLNKTARSPVVHMNNVMSNFLLMDIGDVTVADLIGGVHHYLTGSQHFRDAMEHGAFGSDMMSQEIRETVLKPVLKELEKQGLTQVQNARLGALGHVNKFTEALFRALKVVDSKFRDAYRIEDELFRMAAYLRRIELGDTPRQAADFAREQFIDYDIRAPWIVAARNTIVPFISYPYGAAPKVAKMIATHPWKIGKYFLLGWVLSSMAYSLTGDSNETDEQRKERERKERSSLPERERGNTWVGLPQMMRMPWNDQYSNPVFLDIKRWIPAADIFETSGDMPAWLNIGGPLMLGAELLLNKSAFTGKAITNDKTDDLWDRMSKRADYAYKNWMPSAAYVPNSWYWEKVGQAIGGATDREGRPNSIGSAMLSSVGIKVKPQDVTDSLAKRGFEFRQVERELKMEMGRLMERKARNMVSDSAFNSTMNDLLEKMKRNAEKAGKVFTTPSEEPAEARP